MHLYLPLIEKPEGHPVFLDVYLKLITTGLFDRDDCRGSGGQCVKLGKRLDDEIPFTIALVGDHDRFGHDDSAAASASISAGPFTALAATSGAIRFASPVSTFPAPNSNNSVTPPSPASH